MPGRVAQSVMGLATDACLTTEPGVASSILARYHTFVEIDHEIISTVISLPSAESFKKGCFQLQGKVCASPGKSVVRWTDRPAMICLFDLILYVPSTIFQLNRDGPSWVEAVLS